MEKAKIVVQEAKGIEKVNLDCKLISSSLFDYKRNLFTEQIQTKQKYKAEIK